MTHVFDADGHICEPPRVWEEYAERAFRDRVLQVRKLGQPWSELFAEGHGLGVNPAPACIVRRIADDVDWRESLPGSYEPSARLEVMTEEGIDEACFFPSIYLLYGDIRDPEVAAASCRAYNRWIADFCKQDPSRLHAVVDRSSRSKRRSESRMSTSEASASGRSASTVSRSMTPRSIRSGRSPSNRICRSACTGASGRACRASRPGAIRAPIPSSPT